MTTQPAKIEWDAVLDQHGRWLRTVIYARLGEPRAVEEVVQEVALAAVEQHAPLTDPTKVAPWLYRLAVTQSLLYRRKQGRQRKLTDRYARHTQPLESDSREPDPLGWMLAEERRQLIRTAMTRLSHRDAEILMLKYTEDWTYRQLAEHMGLSIRAVQARLHRARQRLRTELTSLEVIQSSS